MKVHIENPSIEKVVSVIHGYPYTNGEMPKYITIHPATRMKLIVEGEKMAKASPYGSSEYYISPSPTSGLLRSETIYGVQVIVSTDVAEDYIILSR